MLSKKFAITNMGSNVNNVGAVKNVFVDWLHGSSFMEKICFDQYPLDTFKKPN